MPRLRLILTVSAAVLALNACKPATNAALMSDSASLDVAYDDALPLTTDPVATGQAPAVEKLPAAPATRVVYVDRPDDAYEYVDDAYALNDAFADAPPDYGFDYDGAHPWAWRAANDALRLVEATPDGDRYYYYRPGERDPYLVRDAGYSYAYNGDRLVAVYDARGQALAQAQAQQRAEWAGRYYARARALEAASRERHREQVQAQAWAQRQAAVERDQAQWREQQRQNQAWQQWRTRQDRQDRWEAERRRRQQAAADFRVWRQHDYRGQAPVVVAVQPDIQGPRLAAAEARRNQARLDADRNRRQDALLRQREHDRAVAAQQQAQQQLAQQKAAKAKALADQRQAEHRRQVQQQQLAQQAAANARAQRLAQQKAANAKAKALADQRDAERRRQAARHHHPRPDEKAPAVASDDRRDRDPSDGGH